MNKQSHLLATWAILILIPLNSAMADSMPPSTLSDDGACPFECCTYREWTVEMDTPLYAEADKKSEVVALASKGTKVEGITGKVIVTQPGEIEVLREHIGVSGLRYNPGDIIWVYTELGEGFFKVWFDGGMYEEEAIFMYQDRGGWAKCVEEGTCWGLRKSFPTSVWWVKIKTSSGAIGWSSTPENFGNKDACG